MATTSPKRDWRVTLAITPGASAAIVAGWLLITRQPPGESGETPPISATVPAEPAQPPRDGTHRRVPPQEPQSRHRCRSRRKPSRHQLPANPPSPAPRAGVRDGNAAEVAGRQGESAPPGVDGRLCTTLARSGGVWHCDPAGNPPPPAPSIALARPLKSRPCGPSPLDLSRPGRPNRLPRSSCGSAGWVPNLQPAEARRPGRPMGSHPDRAGRHRRRHTALHGDRKQELGTRN